MKANAENSLLTVAELHLSYRPHIKPDDRPRITRAEEAYQLFIKYWNQDKIYLSEQFYMLLLNVSGRVLGIVELSSGGMSATVVDPKLIFATALKACAHNIILAHNHPSGNLQPSEQDKAITRRIASAGEILGIGLADHLIVSPEKYFSFANENYL